LLYDFRGKWISGACFLDEDGFMEEILKSINDVVGVMGCFVCDNEGQVLACAIPGLFDDAILASIGRIMAQTLEGLSMARRRKASEIDLVYTQGRFIAKNLGSICLFILCTRNINVPLLNLTANSAARKLSSLYKAG
jgi:predicted regulator of Ras-like GTPase activity (Roadblock/LC7/MglB family)